MNNRTNRNTREYFWVCRYPPNSKFVFASMVFCKALQGFMVFYGTLGAGLLCML